MTFEKSEAPYSVLEYGAVHDTVSRVTRETPGNSSGGLSLKGTYLPPLERGESSEKRHRIPESPCIGIQVPC